MLSNHRSLEFRPLATSTVLPMRALSRIRHSGTHKKSRTIFYFYLDILGLLKCQTSSACGQIRFTILYYVKICILFTNIFILGVFTEKPYNKPLERKVVYILITTSGHATSLTSK